MPIDFPSSPTVGQQYTYAGITYTYTAQGIWSAAGSTPTATSQIGFRAHKNNVDQNVPNATFTKITFAKEDYDYGGFYDETTSRWTPPAGLVHLDAYVYFANLSAATGAFIYIYKNGTELRRNYLGTPYTTNALQISVDDGAGGSDYYEVFVSISTPSTAPAVGAPVDTYFCGHRVGGPQGMAGDPGTPGSPGVVTGPGVSSGRLEYVSNTALRFVPYNGNQIKINGAFNTIPNAGIAGLGNSSVCFVNGTAGQSLIANTVYWIFAFSNSGVVTADFRTAATHGPSSTAGNEGVEILTGNDTRTLIGLVRTVTAGTFANSSTQRHVASWFNPPARKLEGNTVINTATASGTAVTAGVSTSWVQFANQPGYIATQGFTTNNSQYYYSYTELRIDGAIIPSLSQGMPAFYNGYGGPWHISAPLSDLSEGYHTMATYIYVNGGTGSWNGLHNGFIT